METKRVRCPKCKTVLEVKNSLHEDVKAIVCPKCQARLKVVFHRPDTIFGRTILPQQMLPKGTPVLCYNGHDYAFRDGLNTVGRKASSSEADIQVETSDMLMSRYHALIEYRRIEGGFFQCIVSNDKNKNVTMVNSHPLADGDKILLNDGDTLQLGNTKLTFKIKES